MAFSAKAELSKTSYGDWHISCKSTGYCIAETSGTGSNDEKFRLKIERSDDPNSTVYVSLDPTTPLQVGMKARIEIEGEEEAYGFFGTASRIYDGNEMTFEGDADRLLIEKLRLGTNALIQIEFGNQTLTYWVSLYGVTEALLRMDQEQNRIGRLDAIVAWGGTLYNEEENTETELAPPVMPSQETSAQQASAPSYPENPRREFFNSQGDLVSGITFDLAEVPDRVQMHGYRVLDCVLDEAVPAAGAQYYPVGDVTMWVVPCVNADANFPYFVYWHVPVDPSADSTFDFETPPHFNQENHHLINNAVYDPLTDQMTGTTYYSSSYDCGSFERHEYDYETGRFVLAEFLQKSNCDGIEGPPEGWPLEWTIDEMGG